MFTIALNGDGEAIFIMQLHGAYDDRRGETREGAYVLTLRREPIYNIGREPPEHTYREIEAVWHPDKNFVFVIQLTPASLIQAPPESCFSIGNHRRLDYDCTYRAFKYRGLGSTTILLIDNSASSLKLSLYIVETSNLTMLFTGAADNIG